MQTKDTIEPSGSPVRGVVPDPASPGRRNPATAALAKLLSVIRGDKYMVNAYPPVSHNAGAVRDGDDVAEARSTVAAPVASQTKER